MRKIMNEPLTLGRLLIALGGIGSGVITVFTVMAVIYDIGCLVCG